MAGGARRRFWGPVRVVRHDPVDLKRAFFSTRWFVRRLDASGYARVKHWRVYAGLNPGN